MNNVPKKLTFFFKNQKKMFSYLRVNSTSRNNNNEN